MAVMGKPFSSCLVLIRLRATISLVTLSWATKTDPYVPSPTWCFRSKTSSSRNTTGAVMETDLDAERMRFVGDDVLDAAASLGRLALFNEGRGGGGGGLPPAEEGGGGGGFPCGGGAGLTPLGGGGGGGGRRGGGGGLR